jgi:hypothetical protein
MLSTRRLLPFFLAFFSLTALAETPDTITFLNGDQLSGKLISVLSGTVAFHSDVLGDISVPLTKVKALRSTQSFAVVEKQKRIARKTLIEQVPVGPVTLDDKIFSVRPAGAAEKTIPANDASSVIDAARFHRELHGESDILYGWAGSITLGATLAEATNSVQTYTGAIALARTIPTTAWLPPSSRTTLNLSATYGLAKDQQILSEGNVYQAASISKTDIKHGDVEYDKYFSPVLYALAAASADHNFGNGLQLQQSYGAGLGWSVIKATKNNLDLKATLGYEQQQFYNGIESGLGTPNVNLIGATITENWSRTFAHSIKFSQYVTLTPAFNVLRAYSGVANANFVFPVYKKLNLTLSSTDNYLGDPPEGFQRNSFQFTAGITYLFK